MTKAERIRPTVHERNDLLAQIQQLNEIITSKDIRIRELERSQRAHKPGKFISPRLIRLVKAANKGLI